MKGFFVLLLLGISLSAYEGISVDAPESECKVYGSEDSLDLLSKFNLIFATFLPFSYLSREKTCFVDCDIIAWIAFSERYVLLLYLLLRLWSMKKSHQGKDNQGSSQEEDKAQRNQGKE